MIVLLVDIFLIDDGRCLVSKARHVVISKMTGQLYIS